MRMPDFIRDRIERHQDDTFLKAAMAASALTAYADGTVSVSERFKVDEILERLERIHIQNSRKAIEKFEEFIEALEDDTEAAEQVLLGKLKRMAGDKDAAEAVAHIALEVVHADAYFNRAERLQFEEICGALGLDSKAFA
jgi:tellurite resistance protein